MEIIYMDISANKRSIFVSNGNSKQEISEIKLIK
jgi:hypothetical protein